MTRDKALEILREQAPILREKYGIKRIGIFGSTARNEAKAESDVDIVVEAEPKLSVLYGVKSTLDEAYKTRVDLIRYYEKMNPALKRHIDIEAVYA